MATQEDNTDAESRTEEGGKEKYSKTVTFVGYTGFDPETGVRAVMDAVDNRHSYTTTTEVSRSTYLLEYDGEQVEVNEDAWELVERSGSQEVTALKEVQTDWEYENSKYDFERNFSHSVFEAMPQSVGDDIYASDFSKHWYNDNGRVATLTASKPTTMGLLKHPSEITADDMWEDKSAEEWVVQVTFQTSKVDEATFELLEDELLDTIPEILAGYGGIEKVRWTDCEKSTVEEGVCYDF